MAESTDELDEDDLAHMPHDEHKLLSIIVRPESSLLRKVDALYQLGSKEQFASYDIEDEMQDFNLNRNKCIDEAARRTHERLIAQAPISSNRTRRALEAIRAYSCNILMDRVNHQRNLIGARAEEATVAEQALIKEIILHHMGNEKRADLPRV